MIRTLGLGLAAALMTPAAAATPTSAEVEAPGPRGPLKGTMVRSRRPGAPLVVIIPGSGPTDRDGNNPLGVAAAPYRLLAEALATRGVDSVRIDKRGQFGSAAAIDGPSEISMAGYATDMGAWAAALRRQAGVPCIWLAGHSEGALTALVAARESEEGLCGLILISGAGRRLSDVIREQLRASPGAEPLLPQAMAALDRLDAGERVDTSDMHPALLPLLGPQVQDYLIGVFRHDPAALAARIGVPMLIVHGDRDIQTAEIDARALAAANPRARLAILPGVNHVLKHVDGSDRAANLATYANPDLPIASEVLDAIAAFVAR